jgi:hypothetical protein
VVSPFCQVLLPCNFTFAKDSSVGYFWYILRALRQRNKIV